MEMIDLKQRDIGSYMRGLSSIKKYVLHVFFWKQVSCLFQPQAADDKLKILLKSYLGAPMTAKKQLKS